MQLKMCGWYRDHGWNQLVNKSLKQAKSGNITDREIGLRIEADEDGNAQDGKAVISFAASARLGGDYLTNVVFSFEEVDKLFAATLKYRGSEDAFKSVASFC